MDQQTVITAGMAIGIGFVLVLGVAVTVARFYRQVDQGQVLIINNLKQTPKVSFTGAVVLPIIHRAQVMDISLKRVEIDRRGKDGLICADNIRADIKVTFFVRVNKTEEHVLQVAQTVGCDRASDEKTLQELFEAKFAEALKTVGRQMNFEDLYKERKHFRDAIVQQIGKNLSGYDLEDCAIDHLEQTSIDHLDKQNILDAQGIRRITELTTAQNVLTNDFRQGERKQITKQNVEADEHVFALERQRAEAAAKQQREIATVQAREQAETQRVQQEEHTRAELARIKAEEEILINEQNKARQIEVAQKNRERVVGIESERVTKDKNLEAIAREREVELQRIGKEKALETERKAIADVISTRIAVDKKVAAEEELIKDLRLVADAKRKREASVINAEAEAQSSVLQQVKQAEAAEEVAKHEAKVRLIHAEASLEAADKEARAKTRLSEGVQAEAAASGLAEARVLEARAVALEKQGMADVRVKEANASAISKQGLAQAQVTREQLLAEAAGVEQRGNAEAVALKARVLAEAAGVQEKLLAEAKGLSEKAESMKALQGATKEHEEFRLRLQKDKDVELATLNVKKDIAESQARVMAEAMSKAKINIVGGDGAFFDQFVKAVSLGNSVDGAIQNSDSLKTFLKSYLDGDASLPEDLKAILSKPGLTQDAQNLAFATLLARIAKNPGEVIDGIKAKSKG
jgi:uncharacterized membrane protein YqiK